MAYTHYERLSALDDMFLEIEDHNVHMHVGSVGIFDGGPLLMADGGLDFDRVLRQAEASLRRTPRLRQKLRNVPLFNRPVWVDDATFNIQYHVRHTTLPRPGDVRLLKRLAGRIMSQQLDRGKPLWEMWFVDGLQDNRVAVITKGHHCMVDGISGIDVLTASMSIDPKAAPAPVKRWVPRPAPSTAQLVRDELWRQATVPWSAAQAGVAALTHPRRTLRAVRDAVEGLTQTASAGLSPASASPFNPDIGPHRRFDWTRFDLDAVKEVKNRLGGTVNDVALATVAGAVRHFLKGRGVDARGLDFRAMVPVSYRTTTERGLPGNRVSSMVARLPLDERDPTVRYAQIVQTTHRLKDSKQALGVEVLEEIADRGFYTLAIGFTQLATRLRAYNIVVTNVPGLPVPVYYLGAKLQEAYPVVPLFTGQALGFALLSYDGGLFWGLNADWDAMPDLHDMVDAVEREFAVLRELAARAPLPGVRKGAGGAPVRRKRRRPAHAA